MSETINGKIAMGFVLKFLYIKICSAGFSMEANYITFDDIDRKAHKFR